MLCQGNDADLEIAQFSALLHDIAMTYTDLDRSKHNEAGAEIAEQILEEMCYPVERIDSVKKCILNHSNKRKEYRTTIEERILVNADGLSHFDSLDSLYSLANKVMGLSNEESIQFVKDKLTKDYNEIDGEVKELVCEKYETIMKSNSLDEMKP